MARARVDNIKNFFTGGSDEKQQNISEPQTTQVTGGTAGQGAGKISIERYTPHKTQNVIKKAVPNIDVSLDEQVPTNTNNNINGIDISSSGLGNLGIKTSSGSNVSSGIDVSAGATTGINSGLFSSNLLSGATLKNNGAEKKEQELTDSTTGVFDTLGEVYGFFKSLVGVGKEVAETAIDNYELGSKRQYTVKGIEDDPMSNQANIFYVDFNDEGTGATKAGAEQEFLTKLAGIQNIIYDDTGLYSDNDKQTALDEFVTSTIPLLKVESTGYMKGGYNSNKTSNLYYGYNTDENREKFKNAGGSFEVSRDDVLDFVDKYIYNAQLASDVKEGGENMNFSYAFSDESRTQILSNMINNSSVNYTSIVNSYVDDGKLTGIASKGFIVRADEFAQTQNDRALMYLETPLAEYYKVKQKEADGETLTYGERNVLKAGPYLEALVNDYSKYIGDVIDETAKQGYSDGEIIFNIKNIDGLSMKDYGVSSVLLNFKGAMDALGADSVVLNYYSALDLIQLVGNATSNNYWDGKGGVVYSGWKMLQSGIGRFGFEGGEMTSYLYRNTLERINTNQGYAEATAADLSNISLINTDKEGLGRTMKEYYSSFNENVPEIAGALLADRELTQGIKLVKSLLSRGNKSLKITPRLNSMLRAANKALKTEETIDKATPGTSFRTWGRFEKFGKFSGKLQTTRNIENGINGISETSKASGLKNTSQGVKNFLRNGIDKTYGLMNSKEGRLWGEVAKNVISNTIADQRLDALMSYYDTEAYSPASFGISVGMSMITEVLSPLMRSTLGNIASRTKVANGGFVNLVTGDWSNTWSFVRYIDGDDGTSKRFDEIAGMLSNSGSPMTIDNLKLLSGSRGKLLGNIDSLMKQLGIQGADAMGKFSKDILFDKIRTRQEIDKSSEFYKRLTTLVNSDKTNISDVVKYVLGISGEVEVGPFKSIIKFKDGDSIQSRYLINGKGGSKYDLYLDRIDGQFINQLRNGFDEKSIREISKIEGYDWVLKDGDINSNMFEYDKKTKKYYINQNGADKFGLNISDYTDALKKADAIEAVAKNDEKIVMKMLKKLSDKNGIGLDTLGELTSGGTFSQIRGVLEEIMC